VEWTTEWPKAARADCEILRPRGAIVGGGEGLEKISGNACKRLDDFRGQRGGRGRRGLLKGDRTSKDLVLKREESPALVMKKRAASVDAIFAPRGGFITKRSSSAKLRRGGLPKRRASSVLGRGDFTALRHGWVAESRRGGPGFRRSSRAPPNDIRKGRAGNASPVKRKRRQKRRTLG